MSKPYLSVVVPAYNEAETIGVFLEQLFAALGSLSKPWEIIIVDDGSVDDTSAKVEAAAGGRPELKLVRLSRNFGHQNAICAGLEVASGEFTAVMDADLQDPPDVMIQMLRRAETGVDVVYGVRAKRMGDIPRRLAYWFYYRLLRMVSEQPVPLDSGDFCVMRRRVVDEIVHMPERGRYLRGLRTWVGFRQEGFPYRRPGRGTGKTKYTFSKLVGLAVSGFLSSSRLPLKLGFYLGLLMSGLGFVWAIKVVVWKLVYDTAPQGFSALMVAVLVIGGSQLTAIGVVGYYLGRVLDQVEKRPNYVVERKLNC